MTMQQDIEAFANGEVTAEEVARKWVDSGVLANMKSWQNKDRTPAQIYLDVEDRDYYADGWPLVALANAAGTLTDEQYAALDKATNDIIASSKNQAVEPAE